MSAAERITWLSEDVRLEAQCPMCDHLGPHRGLAKMPHILHPEAFLTALRCVGCGGVIMTPQSVLAFSELGTSEEEFSRFYIEAVAGLWEMFWPPALVANAQERSLLDVGCGFGFNVDIWRTVMNQSAAGCDTGAYAALGHDVLGAPIYQGMLQEVPELVGRRFGIVYASEVIEHVSDPYAFIALLGRWLAPDGVLVLTTPNADFVNPRSDPPTCIAALSPGFHGFLFAADRLQALLREVGYAHVVVRGYNERLVAWASHSPLTVGNDPKQLRPSYYAYLGRRLVMSSHHATLRAGIAYRLFKEQMLGGASTDGGVAHGFVIEALRRRLGEDVEPAALMQRIARWTSLEEISREAPLFLPQACFLFGLHASRELRNPGLAVQWCELSVEATKRFTQASWVHSLEAISFVWPAMAEIVHSHLALRHIEPAVVQAFRLVGSVFQPPPEFAGARAPTTLAFASLIELLDVMSTGQRWNDLADCCERLERFADSASIEANLARAASLSCLAEIALRRDDDAQRAANLLEGAYAAASAAASDASAAAIARALMERTRGQLSRLSPAASRPAQWAGAQYSISYTIRMRPPNK